MRRRLAILTAAGSLLVLACSPEATRQREGGLGADPGNHARSVELHTPYGYYYLTAFTLLSTVLMAIYLKKKKWF